MVHPSLISGRANKGAVSGDNKLDVWEVMAKPEADLPLPSRVNVCVDLVYEHYAWSIYTVITPIGRP